jgi:hypothetical protein
MAWFSAPSSWLSRLVLQRAIGVVYLVAFLAAVGQFRALLGEHGLLPAPRYIAAVSARRAPSLFRLHYSDRFFIVMAGIGVALALSVVSGAAGAGPIWLAMVVSAALWLLYLSIVNVGQIFYAFGWESLLLEAGFVAIFLGSSRVGPPVLVMWLFRWLLFRVEFGAGLIKIRGDPCWRNLTCLYYHHETQPMPNPLSWYFHHLPRPLHRVEVAANHAAQLIVPFALFAPQPVASGAGLVIIITQAWLVLSGNFSWLNFLTISLAFASLDNRTLGHVLGGPPGHLSPSPLWFEVIVLVAAAAIIAMSYWPARNLVSRHQLMNYSFNPFHLVNTYGAFGRITRQRYEVVLEATTDPVINSATTWREYEFKGKPGDPLRRPIQVAPYHLRLDWLMWFAAMSSPSSHPWIVSLVEKLLENDRAALKLLRRAPFPTAPTFVRATLYHYRFTTRAERHETGAWWHREVVGPYLAPLRLDPARSAGWRLTADARW